MTADKVNFKTKFYNKQAIVSLFRSGNRSRNMLEAVLDNRAFRSRNIGAIKSERRKYLQLLSLP